MRNGDIAQTRHLDEIGAHVLGHNNDSIGICYEGGLDAQGRPKDTRTPAQREVLKRLLLELNRRFPEAIILGHRDFPNVKKACPCFDAMLDYAWISKKVTGF
jgi:N-acetylmuramoyl-L-alanine amidase